jgi:CTP synthase
VVRIRERFRHRYEVNPEYVERLEAAGLVFSGKAPGVPIMQVIELPNHPYFLGCQFHPELTSSLLQPSPLFKALVQAALQRGKVA